MSKTNSMSLKNGDKLSRISFMEVVANITSALTVRNEDGFEWQISRNIIEEECYSTKIDEDKKVSKTSWDQGGFLQSRKRSLYSAYINPAVDVNMRFTGNHTTINHRQPAVVLVCE